MAHKEFRLIDHVYLTYYSLRVALAATCCAIPIVLIIFGLMTNIGIQESLSDYYYAEYPPMLLRVIFVGLLFLLGGFLIAYRGFTKADNRIHNFAGFAAWGVAIFPMKCPHSEAPLGDLCFSVGPGYLHYSSALILFGLAIVSIIYNGGKQFKDLSLKYIPDKISYFKTARTVSALIVACGIFDALVMLGIGGKNLLKELLLIPESLGFIGFGVYWWVLTYYISKANGRAEEERKKKKEEIKAKGLDKIKILDASGITKTEEEPDLGPSRAIP